MIQVGCRAPDYRGFPFYYSSLIIVIFISLSANSCLSFYIYIRLSIDLICLSAVYILPVVSRIMPPFTFIPPYNIFQPFPQFYIFRPDQRVVPLIALDELPSWLQVGNWDWNNIATFQYMFPASFCQIARLGEYDVICHHCCSNLDILHKSISQHSDLLNSNNDPNNPNAKKENRGPSATGSKSFPGAYYTTSRDQCNAPVMPTSYVNLAPPGQLPFNAFFQPAIMGMYVAGLEGAGSMQMDPSKPSAGTSTDATNPSGFDSSNHALRNPATPESSFRAHIQSPVTPPTPLTPSNYDIHVSSDVPSSSNISPYDASMILECSQNLGSPAGECSFEVCLDDSGSASPLVSDSSWSSEDSEALPGELKPAPYIKDIRKPSISEFEDNTPMSKSLRNERPKRFCHDTKRRKRRRKRAARPVYSKRPGRKRVVFRRTQDAAAKRHREKE